MIVVCDTENIEVGLPSITYSLRGIVAVQVEVDERHHAGPQRHGRRRARRRGPRPQRHPGRLYWENGPLPIPGFYDKVRPLTDEGAARRSASCRATRPSWRQRPRRPAGRQVRHREGHAPATSRPGGGRRSRSSPRRPARSRARRTRCCRRRRRSSAAGSCRTRTRTRCFEQLQGVPDRRTRRGACKVTVTPRGAGEVVDDRPERPGVRGGAGGAAGRASTASRWPSAAAARIGFVGPLAELFGGAPALLLGIEDPRATPTPRTRACTRATSRS